MSLSGYKDLNPIHLDVLTEVGNIGSGNASAALSNLINKNVEVEMPHVKIVSFQEAMDQLPGGAEQVVAGTMTRMSGGMEGMILLLMDRDFVNTVIESFFGHDVNNLLELSEDENSALTEVGNIMSGAYVSAVGQLSGLEVKLESPGFHIDMMGALMSVPVIEFGEVGDEILYIDKTLSIDGKRMNTKLFLIPTIESLQKLMRELGIEV
ncbi:MAG: chemotaxis protein CheC [Ruminiclostridium sp.]|nr:chemotaxis protein CheC [Ruminiclostridium sp.]